MENNNIQLNPNQSSEIKPISNSNTYKYLFILFFVLFLITLVTLVTLVSSKNKTPTSQPNDQVLPTQVPELQTPQELEILDPQLDITQTVSPLNSPIPTSSQVKKISYTLPVGWQTISDQSDIFQVAFDPNTHKSFSYDSRIDLSSNTCCSSIFIRLLPYDGGSRHQFISKKLVGVENKPTTQEINYQIDNKSALFLYDIDYSGISTVGMIVANSNQAWLIESETSNINLIESVISTLKLN